MPPADASGALLSKPGPARQQTYGQILKSSAVVGGSSAANAVISIGRTKIMAMLLEPAGLGVMGVCSSISDLMLTLAGMGISSSGVRQIAEAAATRDNTRIARTITTLRRVALMLGLMGGLLLLAFCQPIARFAFKDDQHTGVVALLSLVVFFGAITAGQIALIQGMRRIADLARANVIGGITSTIFGIGLVWFFWRTGDAKRGVAPALIAIGAMAALTAWWYSRKIKVERVAMKLSDLSGEVSVLLKMGLVFMASGFMMQGVNFLVRAIVLRKMGQVEAGLYQSAYGFSAQYVGFILTAMGADFYPRLTAVAQDNQECNRMVNEQAEVGLLLAGPGILAALTFAPLILITLYSAKFGPAVEVLRWICLGMLLRIVSWPMGFILVAKGARQPFFWSELATSIVQVALVWACVVAFGLKGAGISFFGGYVFYWFLIYFVVRSVSQFRWSPINKRLGLMYGIPILVIFSAWYLVDHWIVGIGGGVITVVAGLFSLKKLVTLVPFHRFPRILQRALTLLRVVAPPPASP